MTLETWTKTWQSFSALGEEARRVRLQVFLQEQRAAVLVRRRRPGVTSREIVGAITSMMDEIIRGLAMHGIRQVEARGRSWNEESCALVALGGYGRRELFPYSDIDLMLLYREEARRNAMSLSRMVFQPLWDLNLQVGHSVRTIQDCLEVGGADLDTRTALMEARLIFGSETLYRQFQDRFWTKLARRGVDRFLRSKSRDRFREYTRFGSTVYLLEPDIKKSKGGLRDLNLLNWVAAARYELAGLENLLEKGLLTRRQYSTILAAQDFLWKIRIELHDHAGRCQDVLNFDEQIRLSRLFAYEDGEGVLGVERFMRDYYRHSSMASAISAWFTHCAISPGAWRRLLQALTTRRVDGIFSLSRFEVSIAQDRLEDCLKEPHSLLRLFHLSQFHGVPISQQTRAVLHDRTDRFAGDNGGHPSVHRLFMEIMTKPGRIAELLRLLNEVNLLEYVIPEYGAVHYLMQFNEYHKYTIDEHCIKAVGFAESLASQEGILGSVYRGLKHQALLHLALLIHDIGKGRGGDHCQIGEQIAFAVADRQGMGQEDKALLGFLVRNHLVMAHTAFRRDLSDQGVLLHFARVVAQPEALRMLYILTYADISAVGPDTWTPWKRDLLTQLFLRTLEILSGTGESLTQDERIERVRQEVRGRLEGAYTPEWLQEQLHLMTPRYLLATPPERIAAHLGQMDRLADQRVIVEGTYHSTSGTSEYTVCTVDDLTPGIFYKIAGVMAAKGLQILDAQIHTRSDGTVVDTFQVLDPDYADRPPPRRFEAISRAVEEVLFAKTTVKDFFASASRYSFDRKIPPHPEPTRVEIDNELLDHYTIIDVFAHDQQGLLYVITQAIFELGLSIHFAKVSTRLDQIVDVFYVTDGAGDKLEDPETLRSLRETLVSRIDTFLDFPAQVDSP